jgi:hypothetical protein
MWSDEDFAVARSRQADLAVAGLDLKHAAGGVRGVSDEVAGVVASLADHADQLLYVINAHRGAREHRD